MRQERRKRFGLGRAKSVEKLRITDVTEREQNTEECSVAEKGRRTEAGQERLIKRVQSSPPNRNR